MAGDQRVSVLVTEGDMFAMTGDAVVNPWNRNFVPRWILRPGGVSGKLKDHTTDEPWKKLHKLGILRTGDVVVTEAGGLAGYRLIFHAVGLTTWWKATPDGVAECARNIVKQSVENNVRSVVMPLIGAGHGKMTTDQSEEAILRGLKDTAELVSAGESADLEISIVRYRELGATAS